MAQSSGHSDDGKQRRAREIGADRVWRLRLIFACVIVLGSLFFAGFASADSTAKSDMSHGAPAYGGTPAEATTTVDIATPSATVIATEWDQTVLSELADTLGWPSVVVVDGTGKYVIELDISSHEWAQASIRPFSFGTSAETAFAAEQEDARFAGYTVTPTTFYTYPAYTATAGTSGGNVVERRLRWLVDSKIMGVTLYGTSSTILALDTDSIGRELLLLAVQNGMPEPPGGVLPTPVPPTENVPPSATPTVTDCGLTFTDVLPAYWAYRYIMQLTCDGVVSGYADNSFHPDNPTTRAQLAKMLVISQGWDLLNPDQATFADVDRSHLFYRYIETAYAHGVFEGYGNIFRPDNYVTRAQVAKMLVKARGWSLSLGAEPPVPLCDVAEASWSWSFVQVAIQHHVFSGYSNGCFLPDAAATRAQIAKVMVLAQQ